jgi:hypothetical protein
MRTAEHPTNKVPSIAQSPRFTVIASNHLKWQRAVGINKQVDDFIFLFLGRRKLQLVKQVEELSQSN